MTSEHHAKIEENRCFRVIFGAFGSLGGPLGGSWGHLLPRVFSEPENMVRWTPIWAPLADPKIDRKPLKFSHAGMCFPKSVSRNRSTSKISFYRGFVQICDPETLVVELSLAREHDFQKMT